MKNFMSTLFNGILFTLAGFNIMLLGMLSVELFSSVAIATGFAAVGYFFAGLLTAAATFVCVYMLGQVYRRP